MGILGGDLELARPGHKNSLSSSGCVFVLELSMVGLCLVIVFVCFYALAMHSRLFLMTLCVLGFKVIVRVLSCPVLSCDSIPLCICCHCD